MRAAALVLLLARPVAADPFERIDTVGAVSAMTWDGRASYGLSMRVVLGARFALAAQARARDGELVENLDLVFQLTDGKLESTFGSAMYPIRLDVFVGAGAVERRRYATGSYGVAMRIRASSWFTIDLAVRDEVSREPRPNRFVHVPEVQLALSFTGRRFRVENDDADTE